VRDELDVIGASGRRCIDSSRWNGGAATRSWRSRTRGRGLAPDELPRLFTRYYRTREAKAGGAAGLGLGRYIVRGLVEAHGGRNWVVLKIEHEDGKAGRKDQ
jgi:C4-dicarboxylate-specific signal transduction histidine kinase